MQLLAYIAQEDIEDIIIDDGLKRIKKIQPLLKDKSLFYTLSILGLISENAKNV